MKMNAESLDKYLLAADENNAEHRASPPQLMFLVNDMDALFHKHFFSEEFDLNPFASLLVMNAYALWLSGVRLALSGHAVAIFPVIRAALESGCYAYLIAHDETLATIWTQRHQSEDSHRASKRAFGQAVSDTCKKLAVAHSEIAGFIEALYQAAIDFGAHPNPRSVINHMEMKDEADSHFLVELGGIYGSNSYQVNWALLACVEMGQAIAFLFAASIGEKALSAERIDDFNVLMARKNQVADDFNGASIDYQEVMYSAFAP